MSGSRHNSICKNADVLHSREIATYLVSVAGSAGACESTIAFLAGLSPVSPAAVVVALHTGPGSVLVDVLRPRSPLPVDWARSGDDLRPGRVYVAPPATHVVINPDARLTLSSAPRVRYYRPSADWLFESGAASYADRHIAVVLSGMMSDGSMKLRRVKRQGGTVLVQDPATCRYPAMTAAAIATRSVDAVLPPAELARAVSAWLAHRERPRDLDSWAHPFGRAFVA